MKLTLVTPNGAQLSGITNFLERSGTRSAPFHYRLKGTEIHLLVTGEGIISTTYSLTKYLQHQAVDLLIHTGIAFSLIKTVETGSIMQLSSEQFVGDTDQAFEKTPTIENPGMANQAGENFQPDRLMKNPFTGQFLPVAKGLTSATFPPYGEFTTKLSKNFPDATLVTPDGAAFFFAALSENTKFISLRAVTHSLYETDTGKNADSVIGEMNKILAEMIESLAV
ncbi:MAG: hypothetical protein EA411_06865 [Saprospirales bacterium]|nr:MAG: hypothetical protein EA411_06865 [Saprospirales bacterium]